jgi:hypothetical protein
MYTLVQYKFEIFKESKDAADGLMKAATIEFRLLI